MAKRVKSPRLTAKRKVFLDAVNKLRKYFDKHGTFKDEDFCVDDLEDSILCLFNKLPKKLRNPRDAANLLGSALFVSTDFDGEENVETCSEECVGGNAFAAAFMAGWSIGFERGYDVGQEDSEVVNAGHKNGGAR